jgi:hypothetical protein
LEDYTSCVGLGLDLKFVPVAVRRNKPFQRWRYLTQEAFCQWCRHGQGAKSG